MEILNDENNLDQIWLFDPDQVRENIEPAIIRNSRIVGPDDFQWWLMLEQQEQM